jgi:hypothetical protein
MRRALLLVAGFLMSSALGAQATTARDSLRSSMRVCDMRHKLVIVPIIDQAGQPLVGATVRLRRIADGVEQPAAETSPRGAYQIAEDGSIPRLVASGEAFDLVITSKGQTKRVRVTMGMDAGQCHVELLNFRGPIRF